MNGLIWVNQSKLKGRSIKIGDWDGNIMEEVPIPDDLFLCDFCNEVVTEDPLPIYRGNALCQDCLARIQNDSS